MKETVTVNIGSMAFTLDKDACQLLKEYLDDIRRRLPGEDAETMADIEARVGEIFRERVASPMRVISIDVVRATMTQLGAPSDFGELRTDPASETPEAGYEAAKPAPRKLRRSRTDRSIAGICGGLQLLGEALLDPAHVESEYAERRCLGLLPVVTEMRPVKTVRRSRARRSDGTELSGYEIHHGESSCSDPAILRIVSDDGREIGFERGTIFSCYLHGVFDDDRFRRNWIDAVRLRKGWPARGGVTARYDTEAALDRLAAHLRSRIDLPELYRKMGL